MLTFSNDTDILKYEPALFGRLYPLCQVLAEGSGGTLDGTNFEAPEADFVAASVGPGCVIYLRSSTGTPDGAYEIASVVSAKKLVVSVLRSDCQLSPVPPPAGDNLSWRIGTYAPQAGQAVFELTAQFGLSPGQPDSPYDAADILDASVLRQAAVYSILSSVYATLASGTDAENYWSKSLHYKKLCSAAKNRIRLCLNSISQGQSGITKTGSSGRLVRD
jgi:hypothetical protein